MRLAKNYIDIGVRTNQLDEMLDFWQNTIGLPYDHLLKVGNGVHQHRLNLNGSVFKLNHTREPLPETPASGYRELFINADIAEPKTLFDPDGNKVTLLPKSNQYVTHIGIGMTVRSREATRNFFVNIVNAENISDDVYRWGTTVFFIAEDKDKEPSGGMQGTGYRYITVQVFKVDQEHRGLLDRGAIEASAPVTLGKTARISFVTDLDGNWIEISQRASLTGDLGTG